MSFGVAGTGLGAALDPNYVQQHVVRDAVADANTVVGRRDLFNLPAIGNAPPV
jgi:hypothetical protein